MEMPKAGTEQKRLEMLVGDWVGDEYIHPSPYDPQGGPTSGRVHNRMALEGMAVVQDYEQERNGAVNFRGHGIFRWDAATQAYVMHWFDSFGLAPSEFRGPLQERVLTLTAHDPQGWYRAIFDFSHPNRYHYRLQVSGDGQQWTDSVTGDYRKE